jgi:hypothetical protein
MLHHTGDIGVVQDHALAMKWFVSCSRIMILVTIIKTTTATIITLTTIAIVIIPPFRYESAIASASTALSVPARFLIMVPPPLLRCRR